MAGEISEPGAGNLAKLYAEAPTKQQLIDERRKTLSVLEIATTPAEIREAWKQIYGDYPVGTSGKAATDEELIKGRKITIDQAKAKLKELGE